MALHEFLRSRRSIRSFTAEPVPEATIERILESATYAPSSHNSQPWRFAVVRTRAARWRLAKAMAGKWRQDLLADGMLATDIAERIKRSIDRIEKTPLIIVLCLDSSEIAVYPDLPRHSAERMMALQSTANAGMCLLLAVHAEGLGGVWNCSPLFAPEATVLALGLPPGWEPQALFMIGRPAGQPALRERRPFASVTYYV